VSAKSEDLDLHLCELLQQQRAIIGNTIDFYQTLKEGRLEVLKRFLARKTIDINAQDKRGYTPLHSAVWHKNKDAVELLLADDRTDVNARDAKRSTPLHLAADLNDPDTVKLLLDHQRVDKNARDCNGKTPLERVPQ